MKETGASSGKLKKEILSEAQKEKEMNNGQGNETQNAMMLYTESIRVAYALYALHTLIYYIHLVVKLVV